MKLVKSLPGVLFFAVGLVALAVMAALPGCAAVKGVFGAIEEHADTAKLAVSYATMKVIEQGNTPELQQQRAAKIKDIATKASGLLKGDTVTLKVLEGVVDEQIAKLKLGPADAYLADSLVGAVMAELEKKVGQDVLSEDQRFKVATVLGWVIDATAFAGG